VVYRGLGGKRRERRDVFVLLILAPFLAACQRIVREDDCNICQLLVIYLFVLTIAKPLAMYSYVLAWSEEHDCNSNDSHLIYIYIHIYYTPLCV